MATYNTVNGQQTTTSMLQQLVNAGYDASAPGATSEQNITQAYTNATRGQVTPQSSGGGGGGGSGTPSYTQGQHDYTDDQLTAARDAATKAYQEAQSQNASDRLAFDRATQAANQALDALKLAGSLTGPRSAFQQMSVDYGLNQQGFSNLASALAGQYTPPRTQGLFGQPEPISLQSLSQDISNGGPTFQMTTTGGQTQGSSGASGQAATQAFLDNLPTPNQISPTSWNALAPDAQDFLKSAYQTKGYSASDVDAAIKAGGPQFSSPMSFNASAV